MVSKMLAEQGIVYDSETVKAAIEAAVKASFNTVYDIGDYDDNLEELEG